MKKLIVLMAVLAVPAAVMAANTTAVQSGGASSLTYTIGSAPATIPLEWVVTFDADYAVWSIGGSVRGPAALTVASLTKDAKVSTWGSIGSMVVVGDNLGAQKNWGGIEGDENPANYYNTGTHTPYTATINGVDTLGVGVYTLYYGDGTVVLNDRGWWTNSDNWGDPIEFDTSTALTITIEEVVVPEPATMLLLAGALPFLRRRTA